MQTARKPEGKETPRFLVCVATDQHYQFADTICQEMERSAHVRGTGIAKRSPEYVTAKIRAGKAVIALTTDGRWAGFCYIESWSHGRFVANSGLIVAAEFRHSGLARIIKRRIFELSRTASGCKDFRPHNGTRRDENQLRTRLRAGDVFGIDRRR